MKSWWVFDRAILDGVFQPVANYCFAKTGLSFLHLARAGAGLAFVAFAGSYYQKHGFGLVQADLIKTISPPLMLFLFTFFPERLTETGGNPKRWDLFPGRAVLFLVFLYSGLITIAGTDPFHDWLTHLIFWNFDFYLEIPQPLFNVFQEFGCIMLWAAACFMSVNNPPPRRVRMPKLAVAG